MGYSKKGIIGGDDQFGAGIVGWIFIFIFIIVASSFSAGYGLFYYTDQAIDSYYKNITKEICNYANNLTEIVNLQTTALNLYSDLNWTKMNNLNCSLILQWKGI